MLSDVPRQCHRRLFVLDSQMEHLDNASLPILAKWLARRYLLCLKRQNVAEESLKQCKVALEVLEKEWADQIDAQLAKLPRKYVSAHSMLSDACVGVCRTIQTCC
jgi:hypothetical protein